MPKGTLWKKQRQGMALSITKGAETWKGSSAFESVALCKASEAGRKKKGGA